MLTFNEDDTCYLYIGMPKRGCKKVSDVRTAIADPNRQVCFQEIDCNSVKILFSKREKLLNYDNRFAPSKMEVLSENISIRFFDTRVANMKLIATTMEKGVLPVAQKIVLTMTNAITIRTGKVQYFNAKETTRKTGLTTIRPVARGVKRERNRRF